MKINANLEKLSHKSHIMFIFINKHIKENIKKESSSIKDIFNQKRCKNLIEIELRKLFNFRVTNFG